MVTHWTVWANATSEKAARKVQRWLQQRLEREVEHLLLDPYWKIEGCWIIRFQIALISTTWNDAVVETIGLGQRIGRGWILSGDVHDNLDGWSNEPSVTGIRSVQWILISRPMTLRGDAGPLREESFQADSQLASEMHLQFNVEQKAGPHASWESVASGLTELQEAVALAKSLDAYESGVFVGGFVYWTSRHPDAFNHSVIRSKFSDRLINTVEPE